MARVAAAAVRVYVIVESLFDLHGRAASVVRAGGEGRSFVIGAVAAGWALVRSSALHADAGSRAGRIGLNPLQEGIALGLNHVLRDELTVRGSAVDPS